jgi:hypothetical protein
MVREHPRELAEAAGRLPAQEEGLYLGTLDRRIAMAAAKDPSERH